MIRFAMMIGLCVLCACQQDKLSVSTNAASPPAAGAGSGSSDRSTGTGAPAQLAQDADAGSRSEALILPGTLSEKTTVGDLQTRFGKSNVKITDVPDGYGSTFPGVVLFPDDPTRRAYVGFHDDEALSGLASISVRDAGSRWRGKHGIHIGMSFADLRRLNGKAFGFTGFDTNHRGMVNDQWSIALDDQDDRLGALDVQEGESLYFGVELGLRGPVEGIPGVAYPRGDDLISSDDPRYPKLGEIAEVSEIRAWSSLDDEW